MVILILPLAWMLHRPSLDFALPLSRKRTMSVGRDFFSVGAQLRRKIRPPFTRLTKAKCSTRLRAMSEPLLTLRDSRSSTKLFPSSLTPSCRRLGGASLAGFFGATLPGFVPRAAVRLGLFVLSFAFAMGLPPDLLGAVLAPYLADGRA